jgi:hypothetical protein
VPPTTHPRHVAVFLEKASACGQRLLEGVGHYVDLTGFDYPEYLSTVFKRRAGMTPGRYRQFHGSRG